MSAGKDFYSILGVDKNASSDDIKRAYKKLVIKYHPDKFADEKEKSAANARFQEIQEAYDVLKDDQKRKQYDMLGHDAFKRGGAGFGGASGFEGFDFNASGFENIFTDFFSGFSGSSSQHSFKGEDLRFSLEISLEEAFSGYETSIKIPRKVGCSVCGSSGNDRSSAATTCSQCRGTGKMKVNQFFFTVQQTCERCNGAGKAYKSCSTCRGEGRINESSLIKVKVPKGVENGMQLQMRGEGNSVKGGVNGDLYIYISVKNHPIFSVQHCDLLLTVPISVFDAVLGMKVEVPTLEKKACALHVPPGTQPGSKLYLRGMGMRKFNSEYRGDLIITIEVEVPNHISSSEKEVWQKLRSEYKNTARSKTFWQKLKSYWG